MLRRVLIIGISGLLVAQPLTAIDFTARVTPSKAFVLDLTLFGSIELLLDAAWTSKSADLDWFVECDYSNGTSTAAQSQSTESRLEDLQAGFFGGDDGLVCRATLYSFSGSSKATINFRTTGSEFRARAAVDDARVVDVDEVPGLQERIQRLRTVKQQLTGRGRP